MIVKELIVELLKMPQDRDVECIWDGEPRTPIEKVFLSKSGIVMLYEFNTPIYSSESRPEGAPTESENQYYQIEN